jgi:hypothetical protein
MPAFDIDAPAAPTHTVSDEGRRRSKIEVIDGSQCANARAVDYR